MLTRAEEARFVAQGDVHVRIWLGGTVFDYRATVAAARNLIHDCRRKCWCAIELIIQEIEESLPESRLPNERLFLDPRRKKSVRVENEVWATAAGVMFSKP
ncbi:hypothetical protein [Nocardia sp. NPDC051981]|uniref:hypothetical protein n=1 Tax=Nocardia sp. NPDC051981 TaxID=3155417 RepID=UPI00342F4815